MNVAPMNVAPMNVAPQRGKATVLYGPQGCGKTTLARETAAQLGLYHEASSQVLDSPFDLGKYLIDEPLVLIIEDEGFNRKRQLEMLKVLIKNEDVVANRPMMPPIPVDTPMLIVCTSDQGFFRMFGKDPSFVFHHMPAMRTAP